LEELSIEFPRPEDETNDETELESRVCPFVEKKEIAGDAGAEELAVIGD
jgi:hypothetical protein